MKHRWRMGWKEHKGFFVDICEVCGVGHILGATTAYIPKKQVQTFLTTNRPVDFLGYLPCEGE